MCCWIHRSICHFTSFSTATKEKKNQNTRHVLLFGCVLLAPKQSHHLRRRFLSSARSLVAKGCQTFPPTKHALLCVSALVSLDYDASVNVWLEDHPSPSRNSCFVTRGWYKVRSLCHDLDTTLQFVSFYLLLLAADRLHCGVWACSQALVFMCVLGVSVTVLWPCGLSGLSCGKTVTGKKRRATCRVYICVCVCVFCGETPQSSCLNITSSPPACPSSLLSLSSFLCIPMKF